MDRAVGLTAKLFGEFERDIDSLSIVPSSGGVFEVTVDGELIYSKKATGRHAEYEDIAGALRSRA